MKDLAYYRAREAERQARYAALTDEERSRNAASHVIGNVDDCTRCIYCEIGSWNAWKEFCNVR